jgi:hypothetical protein
MDMFGHQPRGETSEEVTERIGGDAKYMLQTIQTKVTDALEGRPFTGSALLQAQQIADDVMRDFKERMYSLDDPKYTVTVLQDGKDSIFIKASEALHGVILAAAEIKSARLAAADAEYEKKRRADPFWIWLDSLPEDEGGIVSRIRSGCDGESQVARFVFEALSGKA